MNLCGKFILARPAKKFNTFPEKKAHPHFLHQKPSKTQKTGSTSSLFSSRGRASFYHVCVRRKSEHFQPQKQGFILLVQCFVNRDCDCNRCADHGVVAHAEEAHHFHGHSTNRWSVETLAGTSGRGTLISCILENTSVAKRALCFDYNDIISHDLFTKQWGSALKYTLEQLFYISAHLGRTLIIQKQL